jgi:Lrp/AsnC family leucine-responsive transcriptional regulator
VGDTTRIEPFLADIKARRFVGRSETVIALSSPVPGALVRKDGA